MANESPYKPFYSVLVLAFFCSLMVAGAAVGLRPMQNENKLADQKKNILLAAGLFDNNKSVEQLFAGIETRVFELQTGNFVSQENIAKDGYNQLKAAMSEDLGSALTSENDLAGIRRLEKYSLVYLVKEDEKINQLILPIRGKGLWSTMYGYIAIADDFSTVNGIAFYEHGETPGLGGEIENPRWQAGWKGKKVYDDAVEEAILIGKKKGNVEDIHHVDGLSGATLTTDGVDDLMTFWFGENGFKPFLTKMKAAGGRVNG